MIFEGRIQIGGKRLSLSLPEGGVPLLDEAGNEIGRTIDLRWEGDCAVVRMELPDDSPAARAFSTTIRPGDAEIA